MLEYVTIYPDEDADKKRAQNHPFIACEMLSESGPIHDKILDSPELMHKLLSFLDDNRLNSTIAGYFSKVVIPLINRNPEKAMTYFNENKVLAKFVQHIYFKSIVDIVLRILAYDNSMLEFFPNERKEFLQMIINSLSSSTEFNVYFSGYILSEVLGKSMEINNWKELTGLIISKENIKNYFECLISADTYKSAACGNVIKTILNLSLKIDLTKHFDDLCYTDVFIEYLPNLLIKLTTSSNVLLCGTFGKEYEALGEGRLRVIDIISSSLKLETNDIYTAVADSGILTEITKLFFDMP